MKKVYIYHPFQKPSPLVLVSVYGESCGEAETCMVGYPAGGVGATVSHSLVGKGGGYTITGEEASVEKLKEKYIFSERV
jgi:hypothetical protein